MTSSSSRRLALGRINYSIMGAAALMIIVGFVLMAGPACTMTHFEPDVFSWQRSVLAPSLCFVGYVLMAVGIVVPSKVGAVSRGSMPKGQKAD